jgi:hypothetical protein
LKSSSLKPLNQIIEEISIFSNNSHLEWRAKLSDTISKWDYPRNISAKSGLIRFSSFRGEDLNVRPCELLPSLVVRRKLSHLNLLLWNPWTKLSQTWQGWVPFKIVSDKPALQSRWLLLPVSEEKYLNVIFYQNMPNLHNRYKSTERNISQKSPEYMLNYSLPCSCS